MQRTSEHTRDVKNFIGGEWEERDGHETEPVYDPATAEVVAETPLSSQGGRGSGGRGCPDRLS